MSLRKIIRNVLATIATMAMAPKQKAQRNQVKKAELIMLSTFPEPVVGPFLDHSKYEAHAQWCVDAFKQYLNSKEYTNVKRRAVLIGDSIGDFARSWLLSIDNRLNIARGGFWIHHMVRLYGMMSELWRLANFVPDAIIVETPGGNNLLCRQQVSNVIEQFVAFLNRIRADYPATRIIVGNLPSSIVMYVMESKPKITAALLDWVAADKNAVMLMFMKGYLATNKFLPKTAESAEGIHMTPLGSCRMDDEFERAMSEPYIKIIG